MESECDVRRNKFPPQLKRGREFPSAIQVAATTKLIISYPKTVAKKNNFINYTNADISLLDLKSFLKISNLPWQSAFVQRINIALLFRRELYISQFVVVVGKGYGTRDTNTSVVSVVSYTNHSSKDKDIDYVSVKGEIDSLLDRNCCQEITNVFRIATLTMYIFIRKIIQPRMQLMALRHWGKMKIFYENVSHNVSAATSNSVHISPVQLRYTTTNTHSNNNIKATTCHLEIQERVHDANKRDSTVISNEHLQVHNHCQGFMIFSRVYQRLLLLLPFITLDIFNPTFRHYFLVSFIFITFLFEKPIGLLEYPVVLQPHRFLLHLIQSKTLKEIQLKMFRRDSDVF